MDDIALLEKYFPELTVQQKTAFGKLGDLYADWNAKINVVSRKDIQEIYTRHILHSLGLAKQINFKPGAAVMDVGTGGGFPGIPLAILFPDTNFTLVDSIGKKIRVVKEVSKAAGITNINAYHERAEKIDAKFDFIVSRAVTRIGPFYSWVKGKFKKESIHEVKNGIFYLKGGDLTEELKESKLRHKLYDLSASFEEEFFETKKVLYVPHQ
ncbi:MAG: 16S rRNA (guanine(527)-N(7))-methyltransferase RsmG [Bacteroidota bacterium]